MTSFRFGQQREQTNPSSSALRVSIPLRATNWTAEGERVFEGRLEVIEDGKAQICLDQPLPVGTEIEVLLEFKDHKNREIRFRYEGEVASAVNRRWYQVEVSFKESGGISGKDAREVLADFFPRKV
jgi:hypothetical protein